MTVLKYLQKPGFWLLTVGHRGDVVAHDGDAHGEDTVATWIHTIGVGLKATGRIPPGNSCDSLSAMSKSLRENSFNPKGALLPPDPNSRSGRFHPKHALSSGTGPDQLSNRRAKLI